MIFESSKDLILEWGNRLNSTIRELRDTFKYRRPYREYRKTYGMEYEMKDVFMELITIAIDIDDTSYMSERELEFWSEFVIWEEYGYSYTGRFSEQAYRLDLDLMDMYNNLEGF